jgi:hypothetical protein
MAVSLLALRAGRRFTPQKHYLSASHTHFCFRPSKPQELLRSGGLDKFIKIIHLVGSRTRNLPACSMALYLVRCVIKIKLKFSS